MIPNEVKRKGKQKYGEKRKKERMIPSKAGRKESKKMKRKE